MGRFGPYRCALAQEVLPPLEHRTASRQSQSTRMETPTLLPHSYNRAELQRQSSARRVAPVECSGGTGWLALEPTCVRSTRVILARRFSFKNLLWQATPVDSKANQPGPPSRDLLLRLAFLSIDKSKRFEEFQKRSIQKVDRTTWGV